MRISLFLQQRPGTVMIRLRRIKIEPPLLATSFISRKHWHLYSKSNVFFLCPLKRGHLIKSISVLYNQSEGHNRNEIDTLGLDFLQSGLYHSVPTTHPEPLTTWASSIYFSKYILRSKLCQFGATSRTYRHVTLESLPKFVGAAPSQRDWGSTGLPECQAIFAFQVQPHLPAMNDMRFFESLELHPTHYRNYAFIWCFGHLLIKSPNIASYVRI